MVVPLVPSRKFAVAILLFTAAHVLGWRISRPSLSPGIRWTLTTSSLRPPPSLPPTNLSARRRGVSPRSIDDDNDDAFRRYSPVPRSFPTDVVGVCAEACRAVESVLDGRSPPLRLDPNLVGNAARRAALAYRPVRSSRDRGRIGVEVDGLTGEMAFRNLAARVAVCLAEGTYAVDDNKDEHENDDSREVQTRRTRAHRKRKRPVLVACPNVRSAVLIARELRTIKAHSHWSSSSSRNIEVGTNVVVGCTDDGGDLLGELLALSANATTTKTQRTGYRNLGEIDPSVGLVLVLRPHIRGDSALTSLQSLVTRATVHGVPTVLLSPRLSSGYGAGVGIDESSTYGGFEPTRPEAWLLRDYLPPVFAWVVTSTSTFVTPTADPDQSSGQENDEDDNDGIDARTRRRPQSNTRREGVVDQQLSQVQVGLVHSVCDVGHPWHAFALDTDKGGPSYVASLPTGRGRPSSGVLSKMWNAFGPIEADQNPRSS